MYRRQVEKTDAVVRGWLRQVERPYVSVSGGKDSVVTAWAVSRVSREVPLVHLCSELDLPESCEAARELAEGLRMRLEVVRPAGDPWEWIVGFPGCLMTQANNAASELDRKFFFEPLLAHAEECGFDGCAMGLRSRESRARRMNRAVRGLVYRRGRVLVATPVGDWQTRDVFAAIVAHDLPLSPVYGETALLVDDEMAREGWWLPGGKNVERSAAWLRQYHPGVWRRLVDARPEYGGMG